MDRQEGVIKYHLDFRAAPSLLRSQVRALNTWRQKLYRAGLIGQDPARYGGEAYGNLSARLGPLRRPPNRRRFVISGTQTGALPVLDEAHYAIVEACYPDENRVVACGPLFPSSESMTHGEVYGLDEAVRCIFHVHSPQIWQAARVLGLPRTRETVAYGTPEMAGEVRRLFAETDAPRLGLFVMGGHEDGLIVFGPTLEATGATMAHYHARACARNHCDVVMER